MRSWSRALGAAERGATPTGIVLEPATKDRWCKLGVRRQEKE